MYVIYVYLTNTNCSLCRDTGTLKAKAIKSTDAGLQVTLLNDEVYRCIMLPEDVDLAYTYVY